MRSAVSVVTPLLATTSLVLSAYTLWSSPEADPRTDDPRTGDPRALPSTPRTGLHPADDYDALASRLARLEASLAGLPGATPLPAATKPAGSTRPHDDDNQIGAGAAASSTFGAASAGSMGANPIGDTRPVLHSEFSALVAQELRDADRRRWQERRERREVQASERLQAFLDQTALDAERAQTLATILAGERAEIDALVQRAREDDDWRSLRAEIEGVRRSSDDNAGALLDDDQLRAYQAMREDEPFRRPHRRQGPPTQAP
ncbi:MAG: hypothetical protein ACO3JL_13470 [Myxococcota bacterium]